MANKAFMDQLKVAVEVMEIFLVSYVGSIVRRNSFEINVTFAFSYSRLIPQDFFSKCDPNAQETVVISESFNCTEQKMKFSI